MSDYMPGAIAEVSCAQYPVSSPSECVAGSLPVDDGQGNFVCLLPGQITETGCTDAGGNYFNEKTCADLARENMHYGTINDMCRDETISSKCCGDQETICAQFEHDAVLASE